MAKITAKASLVQNSNLFLHIADKGGADVDLAFVSGVEWTLTSATAAWDTTGAADADGVINRALVIGDVIALSHMDNAANEGATLTITAVSPTVITADELTGSPVAEDSLSDINVIAFKKTYQFVEAGAMSFIDGCQGIVLASKLVDMWDTLDLDKYAKPFTSIEPRAKSLASLHGWEGHDQDTIDANRDTAMEIRDTATTAARQIYALFRSGSLNEATDQFFFWADSDAEMSAPTQAVMAGYINQMVLIYDAAGADNRDTNGVAWFTRCAEEGKTVVMEQHVLEYAEIVPASAANQVDPKLVALDAAIVADASGFYGSVVYNLDVDSIYSGLVDGNPFNFTGYVEGDSQTNQHVHEKINWLWRSAGDVNFSSVSNGTGTADGVSLRGDKQFPLTSFSGNVFTLQTYLENFDASERNDLRVVDNLDSTKSWPSVMTLTVASDALAFGGTFTVYHADTYGADDATIFQNETPTDQKDITIAGSVNIVMAFSTYAVGGHTAGDNLDVKIAFNRPGFIEPDVVDATLAGSNVTVKLPLTADPSYLV